MRWLNLIRLILATWRLTAMLTYERGLFAVFSRLRDELPEDSEAKQALSCFWCTSVYAGMIVVILDRFAPFLVDVLAMSSGAIAVDKWSST